MWPFNRNISISRPLIYCAPESISARQIFQNSGFKFAEEKSDAGLLWVRTEFKDYLPDMTANQMINHLYNERYIVNKARLTEILKEYDRSCVTEGLTMTDFYQETYCLYQEADRKRFFGQLPVPPQRDNLWIMKPGGLSKGEGVKILWNFDKIQKQYRDGGQAADELDAAEYVVQRYIKNPLLLDGRKSEIRVYWMVVSVCPLMVLMYHTGTSRLNTLPFKLDDFDNQLIHVTNVHQQKTHPEYDPSATLKWSWERLEAYLSRDLKLTDQTFLEKQLKPKIRRYLSFIARAALHRFVEIPSKGHFFGHFGADLIIDDQLHPWLTEIQKNPGLSFDDPVKVEVIPPMLTEAVNIALEVRERKLKGQSLTDLKSVDGYEWVTNEVQPDLVRD